MSRDDTSGAGRRLNRAALASALLCVGAGLAVVSHTSSALTEAVRDQQHFAELQREVAAARQAQPGRATERRQLLRARAQARAADAASRAAFELDAAHLEARLGWGDRQTVRAAVLSAPLVRIAAPASASGQRAGAGRGTAAAQGAASGCIECHLTIATPGYEAYPPPFRTHPNLATYVGDSSPHPLATVDCTACHQGSMHATTFASAGHARLALSASDAQARVWREPTSPGAMLPVGRTEGACITCHAGELYQPGAPRLNEALITFERGGCFACHAAAGMNREQKRGPDLRRIRGKLSPPWVRRWLANPRALKAATWMPRFWSDEGTAANEDAAAIDAVVAYLFANADDYAPAVSAPPRGDAAHGQRVVESVGCLGCHVMGDAARDGSSVRRTFGQPLQGLASKTTYAWLFDWLRDPRRYRPDTRMPSLRLSVSEAADAATYLMAPGGASAQPPSVSPADEARDRSVIERYASSSKVAATDSRPLTGEALHQEAGRVVIRALGCFNCHEIRGFEGERTTVPIAGRPVWLDADARRLHARGSSPSGDRHSLPAPDYTLGVGEAARLALALTAVAGPDARKPVNALPGHEATLAGRALVQQRNCVGCHVIEGVGGDFVSLVAEPTLGPPLLTPEGARVQPEWLRGFLREPRTIRPWLSVRMPTFALSDEETGQVGRYLQAIAAPNPAPTPAPGNVSAAEGKELFDLLKCQQCHVLGAVPAGQPTSNLAPDLRLARERLQPEWILAWLRAPSAILPGTRMPTFWPDYPVSFYPPLNKDGAAQVRAIREQLLTLR